MDANEHLSRLAIRLAKHAPLLLREDLDWEPFYEVLDEVLALDEPDDEMFVIGTVVDYFREHEPERAGDLVAALLGEFEVESEYHARSTQDGLERGCLLFALPFVVASGDAVAKGFRRPSDIRVLESVLREAQVIADVAEFRLVPRTFTLDELYGRTFGEYFKATCHWGDQLLDEGELDGLGPACLRTANPAAAALPRANNPFVELHFLVGVLSARKGDLPDVFPAPVLRTGDNDDEPEELPDSPGDPFESDAEVGELEGGQDWEEAFCEELMLALELMQPPLAALMPSGFHEDISSGLELEREVGLQQQLRIAVENSELAADAVTVEQVPARDAHGECHGWLVTLRRVADDEVLEELQWPRFGHEEHEDCSVALTMALRGVDLATADPDLASGSHTLH